MIVVDLSMRDNLLINLQCFLATQSIPILGIFISFFKHTLGNILYDLMVVHLSLSSLTAFSLPKCPH